MSLEIEQKFRTSSHLPIIERLHALNSEEGASLDQEDVYLRHPSRDFAQTHEAFRIRRIGTMNVLTYKGPKRAGPTKTREENEIAFAHGPEMAEQMLRLFRSLGFEPFATIRKVRTPFHVTFQSFALEVALDEAEGIGSFVEVEAIVNDEGHLKDAQRAVVELARTLGLTDLEPRSYLRMALEQRAALSDG